MVKGFYQMIAKWGLVTALFVLVVINMWQYNRMEAKQIKILSELKNMKLKMGAGSVGEPCYLGPPPTFSSKRTVTGETRSDAPTPEITQGGTLLMVADQRLQLSDERNRCERFRVIPRLDSSNDTTTMYQSMVQLAYVINVQKTTRPIHTN